MRRAKGDHDAACARRVLSSDLTWGRDVLADFVISSVRRLWHFLATTFPAMARLSARTTRLVELVITNPALAPIWDRIVSSPQGQAVINVIQRFWWRDYGKERVDIQRLPAEALAILRPATIVATMLCLLMPLAMSWVWPAVPADQVREAHSAVAGWSIVLWLLTMALAWSGLLVGAAVSNRLAFVLVYVLFGYFLAYAAFSVLPPSPWNLPLPIAVVAALALSERRLYAPGGRRLAVSTVTCLVVGASAGFYLIGLFPVGRVAIPVRCAVGAAVGMAVLAWTQAASRGRLPRWLQRPAASPNAIHHALAVLLYAFYLSLAVRGGFGVPATTVVEFLDLWSGYLWPVWYLLGVGLIFKLLTHTKVLTASIQGLVPARRLVPVSVVALVTANLVAWSEFVLGTLALPWPGPFLRLMGWLYHHTLGLIWSDPLYANSVAVMRWVLLVELAIVGWLLLRRRLTSGVTLMLIGHTLLLWFVVSQYYLKFTSFGRAGSRSALVSTLLAFLVLWILYRTGLARTVESSPRWPSTGRVALYSAIMLLVLLEIHVRSALGDALAIDRVFLYTFRGVVDFGLPYLLCVYASRRLQQLPVTMSRLIGAFGIGAVAALLLNALDKLVIAGGSLSALHADLAARFALTLAGRMAELEQLVPEPPVGWTLARGVIAVGLLAALAAVVARRVRARPQGPAVIIFSLVAAGAGMAAFSQIRLDLPIVPPVWAQLILPYRWSLEIDALIVALFISYTLPALTLALVVARPGGAGAARWLAGLALAVALHLVAVILWPGHEPWLRSSGMMWTLGVSSVAAFLALLRVARLRIERAQPENADRQPATSAPLVGHRTLAGLAIVTTAVLGSVAALQFAAGRLVGRPIDGLPVPLRVPAAWQPVEQPSPLEAAFRREGLSGSRLLLMVGREDDAAGDVDAAVERLLADSRTSFPEFEIYYGPELWDRHYPGARAFSFFFAEPIAEGVSGPRIGAVALLPLASGDLLTLGLIADTNDFHTRRWDLVVIAESLRRDVACDATGAISRSRP